MKREKLTNEQISAFCLEFSMLLHAGVAVGDGAALLAEESAAPEDRVMLEQMAREMDGGAPLSAALRYSGRFPDYVPGLVEVGEHAGRTEEALASLSAYYDERCRMERRVRSAFCIRR